MQYDAIISVGRFAGLAPAVQLRDGRVLLVEPHTIGAVQTSACGTLLAVLEATGTMDSLLQVHDRILVHLGGRIFSGPYDSFHSGLDFCGRVGTELYAVAPGKVVYSDNLIVRGGVVVINHGWGVYTAYDHLSQILVDVGNMVQPGQVSGLGGDTGRTTYPHLHWDVWVGSVQVNPVDWLAKAFP